MSLSASTLTPEMRRAELVLKAHGIQSEPITQCQPPRLAGKINAIIRDIQAANREAQE